MNKVTLLLALLVSLPLSAQADRTQLVPVSVPETPGAGDSLWVSEHYFHNQSDETIWVSNAIECHFSAVHACDVELPPRSTTKMRLADDRPFDTWVVAEGDPNAFSISSFVRNSASDVDPWGTLLPTPKIAEYFPGSFHIAPVPANSEYRVSLRVYAFPAQVLESVTVEIWTYDNASTTGAVQLLETVTLPRSTFPDFERYAPYFQTHNLLGNIVTSSEDDKVMIRVRAPGVDYLWGMASITHNATHHVTVFTP